MKGKSHPKDSEGITASRWAGQLRSRHTLPAGGKIKVTFPDGPDGGTWELSSGKFRAIFNERELGVFDSWPEAKAAISRAGLDQTIDPGALPTLEGCAVGEPGEELRGAIEKTAAAMEARGHEFIKGADVLRDFLR